MIGCHATASAPSEVPAAWAEIPALELPRQAGAEDLVADERRDGARATQVVARCGDFRFRRVILGSAPHYVPYYQPPAYASYVPYYASYDPDYYYVPAFASPGFGGRSRLVRYGRREVP
jgi:hypothetical protein